jgi:nucleoid-associated protein YgaU
MAPELMVVNGVRLLAAGLTAYVVLVALVGIGLRLVGANLIATALDGLTPRIVRHLVASVVGLALWTASAHAGESGADAPVVMRRLPDAPVARTTTTSPMVAPPVVAPVAPIAPKSVTTSAPEPTWTIRPGQHFWAVAEHVLTETWGRPPTPAEVVPYWKKLIEANRERLSDRNNPDLVFPGQVLVIPAPTRS